jgi:hypothetical protein
MKIIEATKSEYQEVCALCKELDLHHAMIAGERVKTYSGPSRSHEQYSSYITGEDCVLKLALINGNAVSPLERKLQKWKMYL